jgi:branched-chain amino acid transport system ATP-binding protein
MHQSDVRRTETPRLSVEELHSYYGQSHVVQGASLHVDPGEIVGIVGRNGAGKTTILKTVMGVVRARRGRVVLDGRDITDLPTHAIARAGVTLVPEDRRVFPGLTVAENLHLGALAAGAGSGDAGAALAEVLEYFPRLRERLDQPGQSLSGGEQQMLALARGLLARPRLLLVDELTGGLMPGLVDHLMDILTTVNARGTTVLLVEQDVGVVLDLVRRCYVLDQGRVQFQGSAEDLREDGGIQRRFLGVS